MLKTVRRPAEICVARMEHVQATRDLRSARAWLFVLKPPSCFFPTAARSMARWQDKLELLGYAKQARLALAQLRGHGFEAMVAWFHSQMSPPEKSALHHEGMRSFSTSGKDVNRWLLHLSAPGFVAYTHLSNPASLGNIR